MNDKIDKYTTSISAIPSGSAVTNDDEISSGSAVVNNDEGEKCQKCGYPIQEDWICCPKCGTKLKN